MRQRIQGRCRRMVLIGRFPQPRAAFRAGWIALATAR
jgi:hypothetical protein